MFAEYGPDKSPPRKWETKLQASWGQEETVGDGTLEDISDF